MTTEQALSNSLEKILAAFQEITEDCIDPNYLNLNNGVKDKIDCLIQRIKNHFGLKTLLSYLETN